MEYIRLSVLDNHKLTIDSVGIVTRKTTVGTTISPDMVLKPKEELHCFLYMGSSDGCITQFTCTVGAPTGNSAVAAATSLSSSSSSPSAASNSATSYRVVASQTQKRKIIDGSSGAVPFLYVDEQLREPRVIVLCNGKITMLHYNSLDPLPVFQSVRALEGATACCVAKGFSESRRLAAAVKRQLVMVDYSESSCSPVVSTTHSQPLMLPDNIQQMELHHNVLICGTKREYTLYDVRTHHVVDQVVVDKLALGAAIRHLPYYHGGTLAIRLGTDAVVSYDGKQRKPIDPQAKIGFAEPGIVDVAHCHPFLIGIKADGKVLLRSTVDDDELPDTGLLLPGGACRAHATCPLITVVASGLHFGALVSTPPLVTVAQYILAGVYDRAIRHYEHLFDVSSSGGVMEATTSTTTDAVTFSEGLRRLRHACGVHALRHKRYAEAFRSCELAETPVENIARAIIELRRPNSQQQPTATSDVLSSPQELFRFLTASSVELAVPPITFTAAGVAQSTGGPALLEPPSSTDALVAYQELYLFLRKHRVVSTFATDDEGQHDDGQRDVDFAMFALMLYNKVEFSEDDLNDLFLPVCNLDGSVCIALVQRRQMQQNNQQDAANSAASLLTLSFLSLLLASGGRYSEALVQCRERRLVAEAIVPLQLSGELALYLEHLPWMLEANPVTAIRALTTSSSSSASSSGGGGVKPPPSVDAMLPIVMPYSGITLATFLDYAITRLRSRDAHIHTVHALNYIDTIYELRKYGLNGLSSSSSQPNGEAAASSCSSPPARTPLWVAPGSESGFLGDIRRKLLSFLSSSSLYDVDVVVGNLKKVGDLEEELVAAYRAWSEHDLALQTLVYSLHDMHGAIQYCIDANDGRPYRWSRDSPTPAGASAPPAGSGALPTNGSAAFLDNTSFGSQSSGNGGGTLGSGVDWHRTPLGGAGNEVQLPKALGGASSFTNRQFSDAVISPTITNGISNGDGSVGGNNGGGNTSSSLSGNETLNVLLRVLLVPPKGHEPRMAEAITLLRHHAQDMNPTSVLESLPGDVNFHEIAAYLVSTFRVADQRRLVSSFAAQAAVSENTNTQRERMLLLQRCVYIDDERPCVVCKKRVGDAVFGVFPNLKVAHFRCFKDRDVDPERGTPFVGWLS
jgi:hypothetical protein